MQAIYLRAFKHRTTRQPHLHVLAADVYNGAEVSWLLRQGVDGMVVRDVKRIQGAVGK